MSSMTYQQACRWLCRELEQAGCDSPGFEAICLLEDLAGLPHGQLPRWADTEVPEPFMETLSTALSQRISGRPLQYILGEWEFLNLKLKVGEGVLIPRPETELLSETAAAYIQSRFAGLDRVQVLDLCAGSGCVGLGVASLLKTAGFGGQVMVTAVEVSDQALGYLKENVRRYPQFSVECVQLDVLTDAPKWEGQYHAILSNPPYIPTSELPHLAAEVQREPQMALDGGQDGLLFYRAIARDWVSKLLPSAQAPAPGQPTAHAGGFCAVEVGIGQAPQVADLFRQRGLKDVRILPDLAGIDRVVVGCRQE